MGEADASKIRNIGESEAYAQKAVGEGMADAFKAQVDAMGADNIAKLKIIEAIANGKIKIVPDTLVSSNGSNGSPVGDVLTLFLTQLVEKNEEAKKKPVTETVLQSVSPTLVTNPVVQTTNAKKSDKTTSDSHYA
jgi:hypothetical protein